MLNGIKLSMFYGLNQILFAVEKHVMHGGRVIH